MKMQNNAAMDICRITSLLDTVNILFPVLPERAKLSYSIYRQVSFSNLAFFTTHSLKYN